MKPRHLAPPERLEDRYTMDADPVTLEFLPVAHGAAEKRGEDWNTVRTAGAATQVHHFEVDQAGLQRHLWSGLYYGWEGLAEFDTTLPEGAVVEAATLYVTVTDKVDTMNRRPSLVAHLATQEDAGVITTNEFANAVGDALGSIPFDAVTPGQQIAITLDPSRIPTSGNTLVTLRTSDLIAGQEPNANHNSRSVFYFNGMRLDVRYRIPEAEPEPEPTPEPEPNVEMRIIDIPAVRTIPDNTSIALTPELGVTVGTGWGLHGSSGTGNILRSIGSTNGQPGNPDNPSGGDHLGLSFSAPITRRTVLTLWTDGMSPTDVHALVNDSAARRVDGNADGTIVIDASPESPILSLSVRNYTNGRFGIDHFAIEADIVPEPDPEPTPDPLPEDAVFSAPEELRELISEAISLSLNSNWRAPDAGEATESSLRKGLHVNLRAAEAPVVGFRASVGEPTGVTAHVYRGTQLLSSVAVPTDGAFSYDDENGLTDVLFTRANLATVVATDVSILTDNALDPITDDAVGPMSSIPFALAAAQDLQQPASWSNVHYMFDYSTTMSGYSNGEGRVLLNRDPTQYTLIRRHYSSGSGRIADVRTVRQAGVDQYNRPNIEWAGIQSGYVQQLDDNTVLLAPGTPEKIFLLLGSWTAQANIQVTHAATAEQLLPPATMSHQTVDVSRLTMNDQHQTEGIFPALTEVREGSSPVFASPGHIANIQYHVHNNALSGGALTMKVYVGWYDGEPARGTLQETFDLSMAGGQTQRISVNLVAPSKPADATSDRPIISAVTTFPDGTTAVNAKLGKEPQSREKRVFTRNSDGTTTMHIESIEYTSREQARIHYLTDRALVALLNSSDNRLTAVRDTLGADHVIDLIARNTAAALALAESTSPEAIDLAMATLEEGVDEDAEDVLHDRGGVGGSPMLPATSQRLLERAFTNGDPPADALAAAEIIGDGSITPRQLYADAMQWSLPINHPLSSELETIQQNLTGRMLAIGFMDIFTQRGSAVNQWIMAFKLQLITDIPAPKFIAAANTGDVADASTAFRELLSIGQYGSIIDAVQSTEPRIAMAEPNKTTYITGDTHIRIRFEIAGTTSSVRSVRVFDDQTLVANSGSTGYINVPIANLPLYGGATTNNVLGPSTYNLRLDVTLSNGQQFSRSIPAIQMHPNLPLDIKTENGNTLQINGDYSTTLASAESPGQREKENAVLSLLANPQAFPLRTPSIASESWYWNIASPYHDGPNQYHAVDLTIPGDGDAGKPVYAPAEGEVIEGGTGTDTWHTVILKHVSTLPSGETFTWFTKYLHMQNVGLKNADGSITPLAAEMVIPADAQFGEVGTVGSGANNHHMHMSGHLDNPNSVGIDLRKILVDEFGLLVKAADAGPDNNQENHDDNKTLVVEWNNLLQAFTTTTQPNGINPNLILDRSPQLESIPAHESNQYWIAYSNDPSQRRRVVFKHVRYENEEESKLRWVDSSDDSWEWLNDENGNYSFVHHI